MNKLLSKQVVIVGPLWHKALPQGAGAIPSKQNKRNSCHKKSLVCVEDENSKDCISHKSLVAFEVAYQHVVVNACKHLHEASLIKGVVCAIKHHNNRGECRIIMGSEGPPSTKSGDFGH